MARVNGIHHIAISTADMKVQLEFFTQVLGGKLTGLFWMHGVPGGRHAFVELSPFCFASFVDLPANHEVEPELGVTHAGSGALPSAPGTTQHVAFNVDTLADLVGMRDRIRAHGYNVMGYLDHGMCKSIYFAGPEGLTLEVAAGDVAMDPNAWIDPEVVEVCGLTEADVARYREPEDYTGPSPVPQPPIDPSKPHMAYPDDVYEAIIAASDEDILAGASFSDPPVAVD